MRAHGNPANLSLTPDNENRAPRDVVRIDSERVANAVRARDLACLVEQDGERILALFDVFLAFEQAVDLLGGDKQYRAAAFQEFVVSRLKLSHLAGAVGSPGAANKSKDDAFSAIVRELYQFSIDCRK